MMMTQQVQRHAGMMSIMMLLTWDDALRDEPVARIRHDARRQCVQPRDVRSVDRQHAVEVVIGGRQGREVVKWGGVTTIGGGAGGGSGGAGSTGNGGKRDSGGRRCSSGRHGGGGGTQASSHKGQGTGSHASAATNDRCRCSCCGALCLGRRFPLLLSEAIHLLGAAATGKARVVVVNDSGLPVPSGCQCIGAAVVVNISGLLLLAPAFITPS